MEKTQETLPARNGRRSGSVQSHSGARSATADGSDAVLDHEPYSTPLIGPTYRRTGPESQQRTIFMGDGYSATFGDGDPIPDADADAAFVAQDEQVKKARENLRRRKLVQPKRDYSYERDVEKTIQLGRVDMDEVERMRADVAFTRYYFDQPFVVQALERHAGRGEDDEGDDMDDHVKESESPAVARAPPSTPTPAWPEFKPSLIEGGEVKMDGSPVGDFTFGCHDLSESERQELENNKATHAATGSPLTTKNMRHSITGVKSKATSQVKPVTVESEDSTVAHHVKDELNTPDDTLYPGNLRRSTKNSASFDDLASAAIDKINGVASLSVYKKKETDSSPFPTSWVRMSSDTQWEKSLFAQDLGRFAGINEEEGEGNYTTRHWYGGLPEEEYHYYGPAP